MAGIENFSVKMMLVGATECHSENVSFIDENLDFKLTSNELNGNLEKGEFYSTKPIYFNINSGFLKSENFFYNQNEKKLIFLGRTKLVFFK